MWILRFHLLKSNHYNKISRICKKYGFVTRLHSPIVFAKAYVKYITHKSSWRTLSREFQIDHAQLYKFYEFVNENNMQAEIFHVFLEAHAALYIGEIRDFNTHNLDNSSEIYELTQKRFESILQGL